MKKLHIATLAIVGLLMVGALAFVATNVQAVVGATGTITSTVDIECPALLTTNGGALTFGLLSASNDPSNLCNTWEISTVTGANLTKSGGGNGVDFDVTDHGKANFGANGSKPATVSFTVSNFPDTYVNLTAISMQVAGGTAVSFGLSGSLPVPLAATDCWVEGTSTPVDVSVGGTLEVCLGAAEGTHTATINLLINY